MSALRNGRKLTGRPGRFGGTRVRLPSGRRLSGNQLACEGFAGIGAWGESVK